MPTYEFRLPDGTIIEKIFKISEVPNEIPNPSGEGSAVRIISGGAGLLFKGSGFYLTDYGRNAHRTQGEANKGASGATSTPAESGGAKSDAAATKSETGSSKSDSGSKSASGGSSSGEAKAAPAPKAEPKASGNGPAGS
ncbi:MAG: hypothetical protein H7305_01450 [Gemmatimonadaceae bacterium]|nr:hypothetical protein [Gemmatimonadaceae bacterium]